MLNGVRVFLEGLRKVKEVMLEGLWVVSRFIRAFYVGVMF